MPKLYEGFVSFINNLLTIVDKFLILSTVTDIDKCHLAVIKSMLTSKEVEVIKSELSQKVINRETLDRIEKLFNDIFDYIIDKTSFNPLWKEILKHIYYQKNRCNKIEEIKSLNS